ncbi:MAG: D-alanyl-D-alanine carboxypeptidase family protein [Bacillota bacterium]|jgi:D-alanyl-D-alanine carboxypeptidase (penicillin-binding protein 5/6)
MTNRKRFLTIGIILLLLFAVPAGISAETAAQTAPAPAQPVWTIPEYGAKAYETVTAAMAAYDPLAETAPDVDATAAVLMDAASGKILYELDPDGLRYPASMTKIVTLLVTLDAIEEGTTSYDSYVVFSPEAVALEGTKTGYLAGATDTLEHCLEMMMVFSANDAAYAIAEHVSGSIPAFAARMNEKAAELGMTASHFVNPNGLHDENHWTTARDMAILSRCAVKQPEVMRFASMESTAMPDGKVLYNTNKLLFWCEGADGLKTGTTLLAGHCLAATAERNGMRLIAVTMGSQKDYTHYINAMKLLEYGFANYSLVTAIEKGEYFGTVNVLYGKENSVRLAAADAVVFPVRNGETPTPQFETVIADAVEGPADAGIDGGDVIVTVNGEEVGRTDLITTEIIHKRGIFLWIKDFFAALINEV